MPIFDLLCHIPVAAPQRILDIGCGPGNSTIFLKDRFPNAEIIGIDNSPSMIERAQKTYPGMVWMLKDANDDISDLGTFDIIFSNSVLHWLPNHNELLSRLFASLSAHGIMAVQIPYFFGTPIYEPLYDLVKSQKWDTFFSVKQPTTYHDLEFYYDILASHFSVFDIWTTKHTHVLNSRKDILDWYKPTGFKAFLDQLETEESKNDFLTDISHIIDDLYRPQKDGKYLLRFERLFFIAQA